MASVNQEPVTARPAAVQAATASASGWGNSAPLALAGFAVTTFMLSLINANVVPAGTLPVVFAVAFMFGGVAQLIAGIICLRNGNVFAGVLFGGFGAFWLSLYAYAEFFVKDVPLLQQGHALGLFLYAFGIFATIMFVASFRTSIGTVLALALLVAALFILGAGAYTADIFADGPNAKEQPKDSVRQQKRVDAKTVLSLKLASGGGAAIHLAPAAAPIAVRLAPAAKKK